MDWERAHIFEVKPLDVNIATVQKCLMDKWSEFVESNDIDFASISEMFESKDPRYARGIFEALIEKEQDGNISLKVTITTKSGTKYTYTLAKGASAEVKDFLESKIFFFGCKEFAFHVEEHEYN